MSDVTEVAKTCATLFFLGLNHLFLSPEGVPPTFISPIITLINLLISVLQREMTTVNGVSDIYENAVIQNNVSLANRKIAIKVAVLKKTPEGL